MRIYFPRYFWNKKVKAKQHSKAIWLNPVTKAGKTESYKYVNVQKRCCCRSFKYVEQDKAAYCEKSREICGKLQLSIRKNKECTSTISHPSNLANTVTVSKMTTCTLIIKSERGHWHHNDRLEKIYYLKMLPHNILTSVYEIQESSHS